MKLIQLSDFEELFVIYFNKIGLEVDSDLKHSLFDKGILLRVGNNVYFRFTCFLEYFIALEMNEDKELYEYIINESNYLDFANEIIYYTGLNQKTKSFEILKLIEARLLESFEDIDKIIDINELANLPVKEILTSLIEEDKVTEKVEEIKLSEDEKDLILDERGDTNEVSYIKERKNKLKEEFIYNLELYSNVLKNCELVDLNLKMDALKISTEKYCVLTGVIYKALYELMSTDENEEPSKEIDEELIYMITIGTPLALQTVIVRNLGTPKLKVCIEKLIESVETDFEKLMLICLYGDLRLEGYISKFKILISNTKSKLIKEIVTAKLFYYQAFYTMPKLEQEQLVTLLSEILVEKQKSKNPNAKGIIKQRLLKKNTLNKHRKIID